MAIEGSPVVVRLRGLAEQLVVSQEPWEGTASELLSRLDGARHARRRTPQEDLARKREVAFDNKLRRLAPNLRRLGIEVEFERDAGHGREGSLRSEYFDISASGPRTPAPSAQCRPRQRGKLMISMRRTRRTRGCTLILKPLNCQQPDHLGGGQCLAKPATRRNPRYEQHEAPCREPSVHDYRNTRAHGPAQPQPIAVLCAIAPAVS